MIPEQFPGEGRGRTQPGLGTGPASPCSRCASLSLHTDLSRARRQGPHLSSQGPALSSTWHTAGPRESCEESSFSHCDQPRRLCFAVNTSRVLPLTLITAALGVITLISQLLSSFCRKQAESPHTRHRLQPQAETQ